MESPIEFVLHPYIPNHRSAMCKRETEIERASDYDSLHICVCDSIVVCAYCLLFRFMIENMVCPPTVGFGHRFTIHKFRLHYKCNGIFVPTLVERMLSSQNIDIIGERISKRLAMLKFLNFVRT